MSGVRPELSGAPARRLRAYHWLAALPAVGMLAGVPWADRIEPYVLGLPFLLFWILVWVVLTSVIMGVIYALDEANDRRAAATTSPSEAGGVSR